MPISQWPSIRVRRRLLWCFAILRGWAHFRCATDLVWRTLRPAATQTTCLWIRGDAGFMLAAETVTWMYSMHGVMDTTESRTSEQLWVHGPHSTLRNSIVSYWAYERMPEGVLPARPTANRSDRRAIASAVDKS